MSHAFPPNNVIGAVRVGKFAKYLHQAGHEVRVVAAPVAGDNSLPLEIPRERVAYPAGWASELVFDNLVKRLRGLAGGPGSGAAPVPAREPTAPGSGGLAAALTRHCHALLHIPDHRKGWIAAAAEAGYGFVRDWRPDIIVASAPPNSGLVAAARIARRCRAPWIAELRDLWTDNPYYAAPGWRFCVDWAIERRILGSAAGLVTVTPGWAATLRRHYRQPVACILNGYAEEDFPAEPVAPPPGEVVSIVYTGNIYAGYRDPSALFRAIGLLGAERSRVAVHFYGPDENQVAPLAKLHRVEDRVFVHDRVAYKDSLALQATADVLLLLQWNNKKDEGNIPAKFFEYLAAGRPVLMLGYEHGDLAQMVRERRAGSVANDPATIAQQLRRWLGQRPSGIRAVDRQARAGMTRAEQFRKYEQFLIETVTERA
ncbi:MAG: glycosyltransferase [Stellaceae bacterium]